MTVFIASFIILHIGPACFRQRCRLARARVSFLLLSHRSCASLLLVSQMKEKSEVWQGTLALMVLRTLQAMGPLHGYGIGRRIEQTSGELLSVNQGTLYPVLLKLEQEGAISSRWGISENNRKARFYSLTRSGRRQLESEVREWEKTTGIMTRFLPVSEEQS